MLMIKAEGQAGQSIRDDMLPSMVDLAHRTGCGVEVRANDRLFWVYPYDTVEGMQAAYDRLYMKAKYVSSRMPTPPVDADNMAS